MTATIQTPYFVQLAAQKAIKPEAVKKVVATVVETPIAEAVKQAATPVVKQISAPVQNALSGMPKKDVFTTTAVNTAQKAVVSAKPKLSADTAGQVFNGLKKAGGHAKGIASLIVTLGAIAGMFKVSANKSAKATETPEPEVKKAAPKTPKKEATVIATPEKEAKAEKSEIKIVTNKTPKKETPELPGPSDWSEPEIKVSTKK
ncbi:hypothetical protein tpqmel_0980, partial [Candidatus Gastranaerophilus sp. (ex Termes propinquus)]